MSATVASSGSLRVLLIQLWKRTLSQTSPAQGLRMYITSLCQDAIPAFSLPLAPHSPAASALNRCRNIKHHSLANTGGSSLLSRSRSNFLRRTFPLLIRTMTTTAPLDVPRKFKTSQDSSFYRRQSAVSKPHPYQYCAPSPYTEQKISLSAIDHMSCHYRQDLRLLQICGGSLRA